MRHGAAGAAKPAAQSSVPGAAGTDGSQQESGAGEAGFRSDSSGVRGQLEERAGC